MKLKALYMLFIMALLTTLAGCDGGSTHALAGPPSLNPVGQNTVTGEWETAFDIRSYQIQSLVLVLTENSGQIRGVYEMKGMFPSQVRPIPVSGSGSVSGSRSGQITLTLDAFKLPRGATTDLVLTLTQQGDVMTGSFDTGNVSGPIALMRR